VISQCSLALPLIVLYEASILAVRMIEKKRAAREAEEEAELNAPAGGASEDFHTSPP